LEGLVIGVEGSTVYLDIGESGGAQVGQEFTIFRKGDEFYHPVTRKVLGRYEEVLDHAQIRAVQPRFSEAVYIAIQGRPLPQADDGDRITQGRIKVATTAGLPRVTCLFAVVLEGAKRLQAIDPLTVTDQVVTGGVHVHDVLALPERVVRVSKKFDVAGWIVLMLIERRGVIYLDATWISAVTGTAPFSRPAPLPPPAAAREPPLPWEPATEDGRL